MVIKINISSLNMKELLEEDNYQQCLSINAVKHFNLMFSCWYIALCQYAMEQEHGSKQVIKTFMNSFILSNDRNMSCIFLHIWIIFIAFIWKVKICKQIDKSYTESIIEQWAQSWQEYNTCILWQICSWITVIKAEYFALRIETTHTMHLLFKICQSALNKIYIYNFWLCTL